MGLYREIMQKETSISLVGLGYVGMPIAVAFAEKVNVIGFDLSEEKIAQYRAGIDPTKEVGDEKIQQTNVQFTSHPEDLKQAKFHIVAVPTPVNEDHTPNLDPVRSASTIVGQHLVPGSIVVFESTVYPGVTEEICIPILEKESGLVCGVDFKVGYSPERINPGDKVHRLETIVKVVSGMDEESLDTIAKVYELVVDAGVHRAESIKVAEAAKVIENSQRDINIAFMNELSIIFDRMGIDTQSVLEAAGTKWNFLKFSPGLVGGHCIGVDPYYLTHRAEQLGYHSQIILSGRRINDEMGQNIANQAIKMLVQNKKNLNDIKIGIFGFTFKENCPDTRNTKVIDIVKGLEEFGIQPLVFDPQADADEAHKIYGLTFTPEEQMNDLDLAIIAVNHEEFLRQSNTYWFARLKEQKLIIDVKGILNKEEMKAANVNYWRL